MTVDDIWTRERAALVANVPVDRIRRWEYVPEENRLEVLLKQDSRTRVITTKEPPGWQTT